MPDAPAAIALPSAGPALRWRRLAWWSLFVLGNALLATMITLGNVPLYDNPGGRQGLAYLAIALPGTCSPSARWPARCHCCWACGRAAR